MGATSSGDFLDFESAREFVRGLELSTTSDYRKWLKAGTRAENIPSNPDKIYGNEWQGWADWLGTAPKPFEEARAFARSLGINRRDEWTAYVHEQGLPRGIPKSPSTVYKNSGWVSWKDWLGREVNFRFNSPLKKGGTGSLLPV